MSDASAAERTEETAMANLEGMSYAQLVEMSRAAEAKASVLRSLALRNDKYQGALDEANGQLKEIGDRLRDVGGAEATALQDRQGTAPSYSDRHGAFAEDAVTANLGGIGIDYSNVNPDLAKQVMTGEVTPEEGLEQAGEPPPVTTEDVPQPGEPPAETPAP